MPLEAGAPAPPFSIPSTSGGEVSLDTLKGRKAVIYFYPKDDTSGCTKEAQDFQRLKDAFAEAGTEILGVSADPVKSHDRFRAKYGLDFALGSDESKAMLEAYGVWVEKSMYGKKYMGIERATFLIDKDGVIRGIWRKVKVPGHVDEVLKAAKAL